MAPRITPLDDAELDMEQRTLVAPFVHDGRIDNVFRTMARHVDLLKRWLPFVKHVLLKSTLTLREREILILRTGWLCRSDYEWAQHVEGGKRAGLSNADIACVMAGHGLKAKEDALLHAADDLHTHVRVGDAAWSALVVHYDQRQLMDIVFTVGQYTMVSMALNSFGVEVDAYLAGYPPLPS
jgi:4-carboxymuconolactone decarboxylase